MITLNLLRREKLLEDADVLDALDDVVQGALLLLVVGCRGVGGSLGVAASGCASSLGAAAGSGVSSLGAAAGSGASGFGGGLRLLVRLQFL